MCLHTYHFAAAVSCPELNNLNNGIMNCQSKEDEKHFYEDSCSFTCNADYELTGSDTRTCQSDGSWSGNESICKEGWLCYCTYKNSLAVKKRRSSIVNGYKQLKALISRSYKVCRVIKFLKCQKYYRKVRVFSCISPSTIMSLVYVVHPAYIISQDPVR